MPHFDHFPRPGKIDPYMNHKWRFSKETPRHTKHNLNVNFYLKIAIMNHVYKGDLHNLTWFQVLKESDLQCTPISIELLFVPIRKKFHQRAPFTNLQNESWLLRFHCFSEFFFIMENTQKPGVIEHRYFDALRIFLAERNPPLADMGSLSEEKSPCHKALLW